MDNSLQNVCPICLRNDAIRKVSSIVSSQSMTGYFTGPTIDMDGDFGMAFAQGSVSNRLVQMLLPPKRPSKGFFESQEDYDEKVRRWNSNMTVWNDTYYCFRDDIIYWASNSIFNRPVGDMAGFLDASTYFPGSRRGDSGTSWFMKHGNYLEDESYIEDSIIRNIINGQIPHLIYNFHTHLEANLALQDIPGIRFDKDNERYHSPIGTDIINRRIPCENGDYYQVGIFGKGLDNTLWEKAEIIFDNHGGYLKSATRPPLSLIKRFFSKTAHPEKVAFEEDNGDFILNSFNSRNSDLLTMDDKHQLFWEYHRRFRDAMDQKLLLKKLFFSGPDEISAIAFLLKKKLPHDVEEMIVRTPEGDFYKDEMGIYKENNDVHIDDRPDG